MATIIIGSTLTMLVALAAPAPNDVVAHASFTLLDADLARGVIVGEQAEPKEEDPERVDVVSPCDNAFLKRRALTLVVFDLRARKQLDTFELAGFPNAPPCATQRSYDAARASAKSKIASARGLDIDRKAPPALVPIGGKAKGGKLEVRLTTTEDPEVGDTEVRVFSTPAAQLAETTNFVSRMMAGSGSFEHWLVEEDGRAMVLEKATFSNMRGGSTDWHAIGPVAFPSNGVDAAALAKTADKACSVSIAANAALERTVAKTMATALGASVGVAQKERPTSVVYRKPGKPACDAAAKAMAKLVPGGAGVEDLTWDSKAAIVVALGASAAIR